MSQNSVLEQRRETRYPSHRSSILKKDHQKFYTTIVNFSASGVGILSGQPLEVGEEVELIFEAEVDGEHFEYDIPIVVIRSDYDDFEYCIGAHLNKVTFEYRQLLKKLAAMHDELNRLKDF